MRRNALFALCSENRVILIALFLSAAFWVADPVIDSVIFYEESVYEQLFSPSGTEIWERSFVSFLLIVFSVYVKSLLTISKRTREKLGQSEERFRRAIDEAPFPVMIHSEDGIVHKTNKVWTELTGYVPSELTTLTEWTKRAYGEEMHLARSRIEELYALDCRIDEGDFEPITKTGEKLVWNFSSAPLGTTAEGKRLILSIAVDVTERKRAEEALKRANEELERRVEERTAELSKANTKLGRKIEEHNLAEQALRLSEERLELAARGTHDGIWDSDLSTGQEYWSPRFKELIGYGNDEIEASFTNFLSLLHPDDLSETEEAIRRHFEDREEYDIEFRMRKRSGDYSWFRSRGRAVWDNEGNPVRIVGAIQDISERKQVEQELKLSAEIIQNMAEGVCLLRVSDDCFVFTNPRFDKIFGYEKGELIGQHPAILIALGEKTPKETAVEILKGLEDSEIWSGEVHNIRKDETLLWTHSSVSTFEHPQHGTVRVAVVEDITQRKQSEKAIQEKDLQLGNLLSNVDAIILEGDPFDIYYVGGQVEKILGYPKKMWLEHPDGPIGFWSSILHKDDLEKIERCRIAIERGENHAFEYRLTATDGRQIWFYDTVTVETENGKPVKSRCVMIDITQRKQIEQALRESEARLRDAQRLASLGNWNWKFETDEVSLSQEAYRIIAQNENEFEQTFEGYLQLIHPDDRELVRQAIDDAISQNQPFRFDHRIVSPDGEIRIVHEKGEMKCDPEGSPVGITCTIQDITKRKQIEDALRRSEERFNLAVEGSAVGIWDWDISSGEVYWSPRLYEQLEYDPQEYDPKFESFKDSLHEEDRQHVLDALRAHHEFREPFSIEYRRLTKQGNYIWLRSSGKATWNNEGIATRMVGTAEDITERKQAEEALRAEEKRLRDILDSMFAFVGVFSIDGFLVETNRAPLEAAGLKLNDVLGIPFWETYWWSYSEDVQNQLKDALHRAANGESVRYDVPVRVANGELITIDVTFGPLYDENGQVVELIGFAVDITQRKQAEQERETLIEELEARNAEMERFTYTVSHDLKSPLITIKGFLGILEEDIEKENHRGVKSDLSRISGAADRMVQLLDELLELSRVSRVTNPFQAVSLAELAANAVELHAAQISAAEIQIDISPDLPVVNGDHVRLQEVMQNLIDNAVKFSEDQPQPRIEIGTRQDQDNGEVVCYVRDNGTGIDPRYHEKVFGLFEQLDPQKEGTGIGLAIVKRIIEVHDGRIWVESEGIGKGTMFCFTVPETITDERPSLSM